ncbi:MAG: FAD-dependent monooxygenase [Pirellulaceae bacterium]|nr:FAD-dependent monooxygenase [Pirellulaceae bacterium]
MNAFNVNELANEIWDVAIVGAGTAGASAAVRLAASGKRVLLIEAKAFPRDKVCGGCLNQRAWNGLKQIIPRGSQSSMATRIEAAGAVPVERMLLNCLGRDASWTTPTMHAISRRTLDSLLVDAAVNSGAVFCSETAAKVIDDAATDCRSIRLTHANGQACVVKALMTIVADGLGHSALSEFPNMASQVESGSRLGLGAIIEDSSRAYAHRELTMAVGRAGYVGLTRVEHGKLNIAAAVDASELKTNGPQIAVETILQSCRLPIPANLKDVKWTGTLPLTRTSRLVAARRLFTIGDSASYVEPFTGEGMSWAIQDALQLSQLLTAENESCESLTVAWNKQWKEKLRSKQWVCRGLAALLRRPQLARVSLIVARTVPWIPQWLIAQASGVDQTRMKHGVV